MIFKKILKVFFFFSLILICLAYGILIGKYQLFPYNYLKQLQDGTEEKFDYPISEFEYNPKSIENLIHVNNSNRDSIQSILRNLIYGEDSLIQNINPIINKIIDDNYSDLKNLEKIEEFNITQKYNIQSVGYIFHPKNNNSRLILYHQGHDGDFLLGKNTISHFLEKGFTIYAFSMPLDGPNNNPIVNIENLGKVQLNNHEELKYLNNPIQYFLNPVKIMIDYSEKFHFKEINMIGISGGGWTTTLAAASDNRIMNSFPVAGSLPLFIKFQEYSKNYGDFEQTYQPLLSQINYLDMYILGSTGANRSQLQILNKYDPCCFNGTKYLQYSDIVAHKITLFNDGKFNVISDTINKQHIISDWSLTQIDKVLD
ncbi:hypothetical protein DFQ03_2731 [Maribacter caenipelagi]|uniref:Prolyl oligopeptidase family protein n=1 Tax=Maribacter caenipelagi TaxID=1447781 RepID=A0A4R7CXZ9_9FLAO|nr:hypothetical protein [Maribacter caenipelagi]TDS13439.1 hypothetical protein DFQ03_2731 [Maribacter caenipelagi]